VPPACALADDFEHHFVQPSHGGSTPLRAVARHPFADKSHSHLLIARGIPTSQHGASSASSSSTSEAPDAATNNRSTNSNYNGASSSSSSSTVTSASTGSAVSSGGAPFYLVPRLEPFSRISGICTLLGDRETPSNELHALTVGDFIRIGSVGLVVTEARVSPAAPVVSLEPKFIFATRTYWPDLSEHPVTHLCYLLPKLLMFFNSAHSIFVLPYE